MMMSNNSDLLFVYGTLLTAGNNFGSLLQRGATFVANGKLSGKLYNIGEYPGAVYQRETTNFIYGKIYKLADQDLLTVLDEYEGIAPSEPVPHEYVRLLLPIQTNTGELECWVYIYNWPVDGLPLIASGRW